MSDHSCPQCGFSLWIPILRTRSCAVGLYDDRRFPGRLLVSMLTHHEHLDEVPPVAATAFLLDIQRISALLRTAMRAERVNLAVLGNAEPHVHAHLIPRYANDPEPNRAPWDDPRERVKMPPAMTEQVRARLSAALAALRDPVSAPPVSASPMHRPHSPATPRPDRMP